jgi:hypothetical protein
LIFAFVGFAWLIEPEMTESFGLAYQGKDIVFRFITEYIVAEGILAP